jgi:hypothetical protein
MTEIWKDVPGWEGLYKACDDGRIASYPRTRHQRMGGRMHIRQYGGGVLSTRAMVGGYKRSQFYDCGREEAVIVHRVICLTFHGPAPSAGMHVRHLDGNPANNSANNLAWGTVAENAADRLRHGTQRIGGAHQFAKFTDKQASKIKKLCDGGARTLCLAAVYGCSKGTIRNIATGRRYRNAGTQ